MKKFLKYMIICIVLLFMYIPILVLAVYSFTDAANIGAIHAFSMHNYVTLFTTPELINMIIGSVLLAVGSAVLATILGTTGAIGAFYSKGKVKGAMSVLNQVPVVNADVVLQKLSTEIPLYTAPVVHEEPYESAKQNLYPKLYPPDQPSAAVKSHQAQKTSYFSCIHQLRDS